MLHVRRAALLLSVTLTFHLSSWTCQQRGATTSRCRYTVSKPRQTYTNASFSLIRYPSHSLAVWQRHCHGCWRDKRIHLSSYTFFLLNLPPHDAHVARAKQTSSSYVAERPRDASCLSVVSFDSTKRRARSFIISYSDFRFTTAYN